VVKIKKFNCRLKNHAVTTFTSLVTLRHRSRDHSTRGGRLPMGGPLWPRVCLAQLWRYGV